MLSINEGSSSMLIADGTSKSYEHVRLRLSSLQCVKVKFVLAEFEYVFHGGMASVSLKSVKSDFSSLFLVEGFAL